MIEEGLRKRGVKLHPFHLPWIRACCNGLINEFQQEKVHIYQVNYIKEITNDSIVLLADARNITLRTHRVNGALVEVSRNPFTEDSESQSNQVSH